MKILLSFLTILSITINFASAIGGTQHESPEYPPYVTEIRRWQSHAGIYIHQCMGTMLTSNWTITAKHCFEGGLQELALFHGSKHWASCTKYKITSLLENDNDDLGIVYHEHISLAIHFFPTLPRRFCPEETRGVFHSFGLTSDNVYPPNLLYSTQDVNKTSLCPARLSRADFQHMPTICFTSVDLTHPLKGDGGSGIITGYGPGPMFPDTHDVTIMGVLHSFFYPEGDPTRRLLKHGNGEETKESPTPVVMLADHIPWIKSIVHDVRIASE